MYVCVYTAGTVAHKMELLYAYGPCSPFPNSVEVPSKEEMLIRNEGRVRRINGRSPISYSQSHSTMDESDGKSLETASSLGDSGQYITTIGIGTPKRDYKLMMDTGSDSTWVRCMPCLIGCTSDMSPLYDPLKSLSYRNGSTEFNQGYGDYSSTKGIWSYDRLTIDSNQVMEEFRFGCGQENVDNHDDFARAAGVLGLGRGASSLVSQYSNEFGNIFGYCLPKSQNSGGYLLFGNEATGRISSPSTAMQFTQLLTGPAALPRKYLRDSLYFLQLVGISVAGNKLNISPEVFTSVGTIIDSGTVVSHLPRKAYAALKSAFNLYLARYQHATPPPWEVLDTCFVVNGGRSMVIPSVTFHFAGGTDVELDESGIGWTSEKNKNIWCLGFTASEMEGDLTIIGNTQQREMEILYDIDAGKIGFGHKSCAGY